MTTRIIIEKLERPEHHGDWHDPLIRWGVYGPGNECQKFATKKSATLYARTRRQLASQIAAIHTFIEL